ncbi:unnamed protein product [Oppiella nova]|uniref:FH2 domain-containing protein n=1 Tax=Oppiella nova TaxID=334625 RepID=A0A7R9M2H1_9ACAR|nr:unnamed protein product [Oppiella nova]CAG2169479.1 unnamed protein product [Oppiella nova]
MKSINWSKISSEKIISSEKPNLWSLVAAQHKSDFHTNVDFSELEELFCQPFNNSAPNSCPGSPRLQRRPHSSEIVGSPFNSLERKGLKRLSGEYQAPLELQLLDGKKSLNVNIFLKQYRGSIEDLINKISCGDHKEIGTERLRNLLKILPEANEIELLNNNSEESHRLPVAEKIEGMLLKEEYYSNVTYLDPAIQSVRNAAKEIRENQKLHEILYSILIFGNFLNSGGYAGDAAGFKMMSLLKLPEIRANKPGLSLIHYIAMHAERKGWHDFSVELPSLEEASKISIENLRLEVNSLSKKIQTISEEIKKQDKDLSLHKEMDSFLTSSDREVKKLSTAVETQLNEIRVEMAEFLCEDLDRFKLEECFKVFSSFCHRFKLAIDENERRRENEMKLEARKSNSQLKRWTNSTESDSFLTESNSLTPTNSSNCLTNSLNGSLNENKLKRRSRRSSQDDELHSGLMEFLKTTNDIVSNDIPIFGGSFRRMGSGRRSRTSIPIISDSELNSRDRNTTETQIKEEMNELNENTESDGNKHLVKKSAHLSDVESDDEIHKKKSSFDRFSPLRKTLSYKPSELESRLNKRLTKLDDNKILINNSSEPQEPKPIDKNIISAERVSSPTQLRQYWATRDNNCNTNRTGITRPSTLFVSSNYNSQQPTAVITPTKLIRNDEIATESPTLLSPILTLESERLNRTGCLPRRTSITSPSTATAAAIVTPIQMNEKPIDEKQTDKLSAGPLKSKLPLPVRRTPSNPLTQPKKNLTTALNVPKIGIPVPTKTSTIRQTSAPMNTRTYRTPSTVSRTNMTSDMGSISSMRRSSQLLSPNRSFMKQTSSSAAKSRINSRY